MRNKKKKKKKNKKRKRTKKKNYQANSVNILLKKILGNGCHFAKQEQRGNWNPKLNSEIEQNPKRKKC